MDANEGQAPANAVSPEMQTKNERRLALIEQKYSAAGLTTAEAAELETLQTEFMAYLAKKFPTPDLPAKVLRLMGEE